MGSTPMPGRTQRLQRLHSTVMVTSKRGKAKIWRGGLCWEVDLPDPTCHQLTYAVLCDSFADAVRVLDLWIDAIAIVPRFDAEATWHELLAGRRRWLDFHYRS